MGFGARGSSKETSLCHCEIVGDGHRGIVWKHKLDKIAWRIRLHNYYCKYNNNPRQPHKIATYTYIWKTYPNVIMLFEFQTVNICTVGQLKWTRQIEQLSTHLWSAESTTPHSLSMQENLGISLATTLQNKPVNQGGPIWKNVLKHAVAHCEMALSEERRNWCDKMMQLSSFTTHVHYIYSYFFTCNCNRKLQILMHNS